MKYSKQCECCGHLVTAFSHNLNAPLVQAFEQLIKFYFQKRKGCNLQKDLSLTKNQYNNFQKLQYFNLVIRKEDGWYPTVIGTYFFHGDVTVDVPVATFGKEILNRFHEAWRTAEKAPNPIHISQIKNYNWKGREEYKEEKRSTLF
jgi:hypothetical protein